MNATVADNISFSNFCQLCTKIIESHSDKKTEILQSYFDRWMEKAKELKNSHTTASESLYPVLRFLLPQLDRERGAYGVKEHTLAKIYIRILSLPKDGKDALKLLNFRAPKNSGNAAGDFAEVAYWILRKRCGEGGQLSIEEVNNSLNNIAAKHATNEPRGVDAELVSLLKATSALEQKWLIRILLKEMKFGIGQNGILKAFHPDAKSLYEATCDLKKVCEVLKEPKIRLHEIEIELFSPLKPMLSEECDIQKVDGYLKRSRYFYVETKLDGERFQLHMKEGNYKYFSRNGHDYTSNFGATAAEGILTPRIAECLRQDVQSFILDGEMMSWNTEIGEFVSKAKNLDVKNLKETSLYQPCFCVFDVLFYNDRVLTNQPLNCRLEILNEIINPLKGVVCFVSRKRISSREEIFDSLNEAIENREEGVVMKEFMSVYKPNVRKNGGWYKIKPEYTDGLMDTLDLVILGGYFGSGRHTGKISHFLLGVAVDVTENQELFYSVARIGSGYSENELNELQNKLQPYWNTTKIGKTPPKIEWAKEKPDVWISPEKSFILEVKASEIMSSNLFKTGYTLRFPRVEKVRYDKSWKDCLTLEEFEEKRKVASGKLISNNLLATLAQNDIPKKKKKLSQSLMTLAGQYKGIDVSNCEVVSNLLEGKEICVFTGFSEVQKSEVERKIVEYGGILVQNPGKKTFCVLAEADSTVRIKNVIQSGLHDVIRTSWFYHYLGHNVKKLPEFKPNVFVGMSEKTAEVFSKSYDEYGDHFTIPSTRETIEHSLEIAHKKNKDSELTIDEKFNMDVELFSGSSAFSLFRLCTAYFDRYPIIEDPTSGLLPDLEIYEIDFKFRSGKLSRLISDEVTHVVLFSGDLSRLEEIKIKNLKRRRKFHIVTETWIQSSITNKFLSTDIGL